MPPAALGTEIVEVRNAVTGEVRRSCADPLSWQWIAPLALGANLGVGFMAAALAARCGAAAERRAPARITRTGGGRRGAGDGLPAEVTPAAARRPGGAAGFIELAEEGAGGGAAGLGGGASVLRSGSNARHRR